MRRCGSVRLRESASLSGLAIFDLESPKQPLTAPGAPKKLASCSETSIGTGDDAFGGRSVHGVALELCDETYSRDCLPGTGGGEAAGALSKSSPEHCVVKEAPSNLKKPLEGDELMEGKWRRW